MGGSLGGGKGGGKGEGEGEGGGWRTLDDLVDWLVANEREKEQVRSVRREDEIDR